MNIFHPFFYTFFTHFHQIFWFVLEIWKMTNWLRICWVRIYWVSEFTETEVVNHSLGYLTDHLSRWTPNKSCSQYFVGSFVALNLINTPFGFTYSSIASIKKFSVNIIFDPLFFKCHLIHTNWGNLRIRVSTGWQYDIVLTFLTLEQCIPHYISSMDIRVMRELWSRQAITNCINVRVWCL